MERGGNLLRLVASLLLALVIFLGRLAMVLLAIVPTWIGRWIDSLPLRRAARARARSPAAGRASCSSAAPSTTRRRCSRSRPSFPECEPAFTWYYCDGVLEVLRRLGVLESTALGGKLRARCLAYLEAQGLPLDLGGARGHYDLVDHLLRPGDPPQRARRPVVLVQEGMTDPEDVIFRSGAAFAACRPG